MNVRFSRLLDDKIELKHLRHAVAAADFGSFRQAADALNIQQSTLSRSISQLEHATSRKLFTRSTGGIVVAELGVDFVRMARAVLEQINEFAPSVTPSQKQLLRIGFCTSLLIGGLRSSLVEFHKCFPQFRLSMLERSRSRLSLTLRSGTLDLIICTGKLPVNCESTMLWSERVLIAMPEDHYLAARDTVYWTDLRSITLLITQDEPYWDFEDLITSKLVSPDDRPKFEHHNVSSSVLKSMISMKFGVGLVLESDVDLCSPSIVFKELRDGTGPSRIQFSAFWLKDNKNPALAGLLQILRERYPVLAQ